MQVNVVALEKRNSATCRTIFVQQSLPSDVQTCVSAMSDESTVSTAPVPTVLERLNAVCSGSGIKVTNIALGAETGLDPKTIAKFKRGENCSASTTKKISDYCESHERSNITNKQLFVSPTGKKASGERSTGESKERKPIKVENGYVYVVKIMEGHTKIGFSAHPLSRLSTAQTFAPAAELIFEHRGSRWVETKTQVMLQEFSGARDSGTGKGKDVFHIDCNLAARAVMFAIELEKLLMDIDIGDELSKEVGEKCAVADKEEEVLA